MSEYEKTHMHKCTQPSGVHKGAFEVQNPLSIRVFTSNPAQYIRRHVKLDTDLNRQQSTNSAPTTALCLTNAFSSIA